MVALESILFAASPAPAAPAPAASLPRQIESDLAIFDCYSLAAAPSECRLLGNPGILSQGAYAGANSITAGEDMFALGLGAWGHDFDECRGLFGEFLAAAGSAAYMPTDGTSTPDYVMKLEELVPEIQALYAIVFRGSPCYLLRFECATRASAVPLSEVVRACASVAGTPDFGIVMAAEVAGLVCAILRRSPDQPDPARFDFPGVRDWLSFTPEHEHARTSSLVVGAASASPREPLRPFLRPVSDQHHGHFHAAVTAFRSLPRGKLEIADVLAQVFQPRSVVSVVHLLRDLRPIEGAGESEFLRGACWVFPLASLPDGGRS
jgi:hypothetical protein